MKTMRVKRLSPDAKLPVRATASSAGYDLCACVDKPVLVPAGGRVMIPTGIAVEIDEGYAGFVFGRSGLGIKHGLAPSNAVGVIDSDYRGEIMVGLSNHSDEDYFIQPSERIAQLVLQAVELPETVEVHELTETARGEGGFGSTGKG